MRAVQFLKRYLEHPDQVGAIAPTSRAVAEVVIRAGRVREARSVVELGPGDGAITEVLLETLRSDATFFAVEISEEFCAALRKRFPNVTVYHDSAENIGPLLEKRGLSGCDSVVSGLPWASFDPALQQRLLSAVADALNPGGWFVTYTYVLSPYLEKGRRFKALLDRTFSHVERTPLVVRNLPPAFAYAARK